VIRGIGEIRGYDQPAGGSPGVTRRRHPATVPECGLSGRTPSRRCTTARRSARRWLTGPDLHRRVAAAGRRVVVNRLCPDRVVPMYEPF
jgi:hypothetical protein